MLIASTQRNEAMSKERDGCDGDLHRRKIKFNKSRTKRKEKGGEKEGGNSRKSKASVALVATKTRSRALENTSSYTEERNTATLNE